MQITTPTHYASKQRIRAMFDIRFVERSVSAPEYGGNISITVNILQSRHALNPEESGVQDVIWSEWEDVRVEEEGA